MKAPKSRTFHITTMHEGKAGCGVNLVSVLFGCWACKSIGLVTIHADDAGVELSNYVDYLLPKKSSRCRVLIDKLNRSDVLISCACGRPGRHTMQITLG